MNTHRFSDRDRGASQESSQPVRLSARSRLPIHPGSAAARARALEAANQPWSQGPRIEPRRVDGSLVVRDPVTGDRVSVYTPRFNVQFQEGHEAARWYIRPVAAVGARPLSRSFPTAKAAVEAVEQARWRLDPPSASRPAPRRTRVIYRMP